MQSQSNGDCSFNSSIVILLPEDNIVRIYFMISMLNYNVNTELTNRSALSFFVYKRVDCTWVYCPVNIEQNPPTKPPTNKVNDVSRFFSCACLDLVPSYEMET